MSECIHSVYVDLFIPTCLFGHVFVVIPTEGSVFTLFGVDTGMMRLQFDLNRVAGQQAHDKLCIQEHQSTAQLPVL